MIATAAAVVALGLGDASRAQVAPPSPVPAATAQATASASPAPVAGDVSPAPVGSAALPATQTPTPVPFETPTPPPIVVNPESAGVIPGGTQELHVYGVLGSVTLSIADPNVASATIDQDTRILRVFGHVVGTTTITLRDERGITRDVPVRVAELAGTVGSFAAIHITGNPATQLYVKQQAVDAAVRAAQTKPGATVIATADSVTLAGPLAVDDVVTVSVPIIIQGGAYFTVQGTTRVRVANDAEPIVRPQQLLVSDYPETLKANGVLFTADLTQASAERFLYYHYNPAGQPDRRILLKAENASTQPALVQFISGSAGPGIYEMEVGHLSTQRFLVRLAQNEGSVITLPAHSTTTLVNQALPAGNIVSNILQLHEVEGPPIHLTLFAQNADDPTDGPVPASALLSSDVKHARGIYEVPEFFFETTYATQDPDLEIPIGQYPLPNLLQGEALAGDYGVLQSVTIRLINTDLHNTAHIALYASPRGGHATGTFIVDRVLVQAHAMAPFGRYKLRQYTIPPGTYVSTDIVTMPEGGSSYPVRLVVAPDDGSAAPGSSDSPVY